MTAAQLHFHELNSRDIEGTDRVEACADQRKDSSLEHIVGRLSLEPHVTGALWRHEAEPGAGSHAR
jgi:putative Mg2+ transporter-C (MgtC) family protein